MPTANNNALTPIAERLDQAIDQVLGQGWPGADTPALIKVATTCVLSIVGSSLEGKPLEVRARACCGLATDITVALNKIAHEE